LKININDKLINFEKEEVELESDLEQWMYVLKNMSSMNKLSTYLKKPIFKKLFEIAEYSKLNKEERKMYDVSLKRKWDNKAVLDYARQEGEEKARKEERAKAEAEKLAEKLKSALNLKKRGLPVEDIAEDLGLTVEQVEKLK